MEGLCLDWTQTADFANGTITSNGVWYSVAGSSVESDCVGRVYLEVNEPVTFEPSTRKNPNTGVIRKVAINIHRPWKDITTNWRTHREICQVKDCPRQTGSNWLIREIGGLLVVRLDDLDGLIPGSIVECGVTPPPAPYKTWVAHDIVVLADSEAEYEQSLEAQ
jgi:hypothetical protein